MNSPDLQVDIDAALIGAVYAALAEGQKHVDAFTSSPGYEWDVWPNDESRMMKLISGPLRSFWAGLDTEGRKELKQGLQYLLNVDEFTPREPSENHPGLSAKTTGIGARYFASYQDTIQPYDWYTLCLWMWKALFPNEDWHTDIRGWVSSRNSERRKGRYDAYRHEDDSPVPLRVSDASTGLIDAYRHEWAASDSRVMAGISHVETAVVKFVKNRCVEDCLQSIERNDRDAYGSVLRLARHSLHKALLAWFRDATLDRFKQHAYEVAKLQRIAFHDSPNRTISDEVYFAPLLCDHPALLAWFREHDLMPYRHMVDPRAHSYRWWQMTYALQGDWIVLGVNARQALEQQLSVVTSDESFLDDQRFFHALAAGDIEGMKSALKDLATESAQRRRLDHTDFLVTDYFVSTHAVMYAKLAWIWGYQLDVDSPWIPREWLPVTPLERYEDPYPFMQRFDIEAPLERRPW